MSVSGTVSICHVLLSSDSQELQKARTLREKKTKIGAGRENVLLSLTNLNVL